MQPITGDKDYVASKIREYFFAGKKDRQDGKSYKPSKKFLNPEIWVVAAEICIELKADPYSFVRAAFLYNSVSGGPYPHQLTGNAIRHWYAHYKKTVNAPEGVDVYECEVQSLITYSATLALRMATSNNETLVSVMLSDFWLKLDVVPAFVRVVLVPNDSAIYKKWGRLAYREIMCNQRLLCILQTKEYDLNFLQRIEEEMRAF